MRDYEEAEDYDKEDIRCAICREVGEGAAFAAFKRWLLWDHKEKYQELLHYCERGEPVRDKETENNKKGKAFYLQSACPYVPQNLVRVYFTGNPGFSYSQI